MTEAGRRLPEQRPRLIHRRGGQRRCGNGRRRLYCGLGQL